MKLQSALLLTALAGLAAACSAPAGTASDKGGGDDPSATAVSELKLKDYRPQSIFRIPVTEVRTARYPIIDIHSHDYANTPEELADWVATLDSVGVRISAVQHCNWIGDSFEEVLEEYAPYKDRFCLWCCFDYTDFEADDWTERAVAYLEKCRAAGAVGVGELVDKGLGDVYARPVPGNGIHMDNPRLKPLIERCGELGMPISIHIAEPIWMYEPLDAANDGLMNGATWAVDTSAEGCRNYDELMETFERTLAAYPGTTFIACHYLNMTQDYERLGALLEKYPNLYLDIAGRIGESAVTPRATRRFLVKWADRVLYGTDNGMSGSMYRMTFRILETDDEHIYNPDYGYHWAYAGFDLPDDVLRKLYYENAARLLNL